MGFRYRRSIAIVPGVRLNVSKRGVGMSAGVRGARVSVSPGGRVTRTLSIPGTGLSHVQSLGSGRRSGSGSMNRGPVQADPAPPKPGMLSPKAEKELYNLINSGQIVAKAGLDLPRIAGIDRSYRLLCMALEGFAARDSGQVGRARHLLAYVAAQDEDVTDHPFTRKYLAPLLLDLEICVGIGTALPLDRDTCALAVAEMHQAAGDLDVAIATVERCTPTTVAALSLADLYLEAGRPRDVLEVTEGITNTDDVTALLLTLRGAALTEIGYNDAAKESLTEALRSKSRSPQVRHRALIVRAGVHQAAGRKAMARKDLERVLAEDHDYPGVTELIASLG